jgi:hypothetical protein
MDWEPELGVFWLEWDKLELQVKARPRFESIMISVRRFGIRCFRGRNLCATNFGVGQPGLAINLSYHVTSRMPPNRVAIRFDFCALFIRPPTPDVH